MHAQISKKDAWKMFDKISPTYDLVNRILSLGIDHYWRKQVAHFLPRKHKLRLLDCATGTGDQIFSLMKHSTRIHQAVGIDLAGEMLKVGKAKLQGRRYAHQVTFTLASALELPFIENSFECATISFGIRNLPDVKAALKEMYRVIAREGRVLVLEFSRPQHCFLGAAHLFYLRHILPKIGGWISKNKEAYSYLNETIETFPHGKAFCKLLEEAGFKNVQAYPLTFGIATLYQGDK